MQVGGARSPIVFDFHCDLTLIVFLRITILQECDEIAKSLERELKQSRIQKQIESTQRIFENSRRGATRSSSSIAAAASDKMGLQDRLTKGVIGLGFHLCVLTAISVFTPGILVDCFRIVVISL